MDREMQQMMRVLVACWVGAILLVATGLGLAVFVGTGAVRAFLLVLLGMSVANVMLMGLIRLYTRVRLDLPIVGGLGMAACCGLLLMPGAGAFPGDGMAPERLEGSQVVRALPDDEGREWFLSPLRFDSMPGGYGVIRDSQ